MLPNPVMRVEVELKNYRCFPLSRPARITLGRRFTGLVGINNAGKSALLRAFYELRAHFGTLSSPNGNLLNMLTGNAERLDFLGVRDPDEVFSHQNRRGIEIRFHLLEEAPRDGVTVPERAASAQHPPREH